MSNARKPAAPVRRNILWVFFGIIRSAAMTLAWIVLPKANWEKNSPSHAIDRSCNSR